MSNFRGHITFGAITAMLGTTFVYFYALITDLLLLVILFLVTVIASFLPDIDSDSSISYRIIFGTLTLAVTGTLLHYMLTYFPDEFRYVIGVPVVTLLLMWFGVGGIVKKMTVHRGMMHSIPVALIAALLTYLTVKYLDEENLTAMVFAWAMGLGYFAHLILDELHAGINLDGSIFHPKKSLGTALKFVSTKRNVTIFTYCVLAVLVYISFLE